MLSLLYPLLLTALHQVVSQQVCHHQDFSMARYQGPVGVQYISELAVSLDESEESQLSTQGFNRINVDLNKGAKGRYIYLWYKRDGCAGITRIQLSFTEEMTGGLTSTGYHKINKDLNAGASGDYVYLWYYKGNTEYDIPIVDLQVSTDTEDEAQKMISGWERLACDLNRGSGGNWIYLWVKRAEPVFISDITVTSNFYGDTSNFQNGWIRVDEDTNRGARGAYVFIWYRLTTNSQNAIRDLQVSISNDEYYSFQSQSYQVVNVDLNQGAGGKYVFLWFKKDGCGKEAIKTVSVIVNTEAAAVEPLKRVGVQVLTKDLNSGNQGSTEYLCFYP